MSGFFDRTKAAIDAKHDLLDEIATGLSGKKPTEEIYKHVEAIANQSNEPFDAESDPAQYYTQFKMLYANEILQTRAHYGDEKGLAEALSHGKKPWPKLRKN